MKLKKLAIIIAIPFLLISQYFLFKYGIIRPMIKGVEIKIVEGDYINDIDKYVIKVDETVKLSMGDFIRIPSYAKQNNLTFKVLDSSNVVYIEGNELIGLKEGYASIGIMNSTNLLKKATIKVVKQRVEDLKIDLENDLVYVGDISNINTIVEVDYKQFKEPKLVEYESSDDEIIKISDNVVEAVGVGKATLYAKSGEKIESIDVDIKAKVTSIDIDKNIEIDVDESKKLKPYIITSPKNLKYPTIEYTLLGAKLPISRAISLSPDGMIVGLREGEEEIKVKCGNMFEIITVKVSEVPITNKTIENFNLNYEIVNNNILIDFTWDYLKNVNYYRIYMKDNLSNEDFSVCTDIQVKNNEVTKIKESIKLDFSNKANLEFYVVGYSELGETLASKILKIRYPEDEKFITNLQGYFDKNSSTIKLNWSEVEEEGVVYSVYTKNISNNEDAFTLYQHGITTTEFSINVSKDAMEYEIYVIANCDGKNIQSKTIKVKKDT
jgi:hypothetical protein